MTAIPIPDSEFKGFRPGRLWRLAISPQENIDTAFFLLSQGLMVIREQLGEERYAVLEGMSDRTKALFESGPEDETGDSRAQHMRVQAMEDISTSVDKRETAKQLCQVKSA